MTARPAGHASLTDRWGTLPIAEQLAHVGSEVGDHRRSIDACGFNADATCPQCAGHIAGPVLSGAVQQRTALRRGVDFNQPHQGIHVAVRR